jgi:flagellar M-ring protein FliF
MAAEAAVAPSNGLIRLSAGVRPLLLLLGVAAAVAAGVGAVLWSQGPTWNLLSANLAGEDAAAVTQALSGAGIPYRLENATGGISVPREKLNDARLLLAGQGLVDSSGFASMVKDPGLGLSQFMETARYQHALESELARTIASLTQVSGARVHIAAPRNSAFVRDRQPATASVFIQLRPGRRLAGEQVTAIVNLVASSVPELDTRSVTIVDQQGRLLSSPQGSDAASARDQQLEYARQVEDGYAQRIESLLAPIVGAGRVKAEVSAQFDMSATEEAREQYRPESQVVRSEQLAEERSRGAGAGPGGVPGALSNQPPERAVALAPGAQPARSGVAGPDAATATADGASDASSSRQSTRNYEIDRTLAYTRQPAGRLTRLSVAVLIDNVRLVGKDGKATEAPLDKDQLDRVTALVKDAVGFDAQRGDSVNILNVPWRGLPVASGDDLETIPIWQQPWARDLAKLVAGLLIVLVLVFVVLRPLLRQLLGASRAASAAAATAGAVVALPDGRTVPASSLGADGSVSPGVGQPLAYEQQVAQARTLVAQDPARVAQVVKQWVSADG